VLGDGAANAVRRSVIAQSKARWKSCTWCLGILANYMGGSLFSRTVEDVGT
jgi:hypothetical protein